MVMLPGQTFTIRENNINVATGIITEVLNNVAIVNENLSKVEIKH